MKINRVAVLAVGLMVGAAGCKKKSNNEGGQAKPSEGSAAVADPPKDPPPPAAPDGAKIAELYIACMGLFSDKKFDEFGSKCLADNFVSHETDMPEAKDRAKALADMKGWTEAFPDVKLEPQLVLVSGQTVLAVVLGTGTHTATLKSPMGDIPATNKKIGQLMFQRLSINPDLKATEEWFTTDPTTMIGQLGLLPKEAPPVRPALDKGLEGAPIIIIAKDDAKEKANLEAVIKGEAAFNGHKIDEIMAMYADDAVESDQAGHEDTKGAAAIKAGTEMFIKAFSDVKLDIPDKWAVGDYVVSSGTFTGTNDGDMGPMKATGKPVRGGYTEVLELKDGKVTKMWRFRNGMSMAIQLGLMPAPGAPPADAKKSK